MRYIVLRGDTLAAIARHYGVSAESIARRNGITDPRRLEVGTELVIPSPREIAAELAEAWEEGDDGRPAGELRFAWPVYGRVSSAFGRRWGRDHEGIDIRAESGTAVRAAEAGRVIHAGALGAYGNVVILKHAGGWSTVYAHNRTLRVRKGDDVRKGEWIAEVGATGNATAPHLHFEVRHAQAAQDPLRYLPTLVARRPGWSATR
jgi:murein DD-endopeptidase MepM/ murein hydrolase activator NlpD